MDSKTEFWFDKCVACNVPGRTNKNYDAVIEVSMKRLLECEDQYPMLQYQLKCRKKANEKMKEGNNYYLTQGNNALALVSYTQGISYAPLNSRELAKGYANRSAITCELGYYEDSLKDIERALDIGYPDDLKAKLYVRRAKNLLSLNSEMRPEVKEAVSEARRWMSLMTYPHKIKIENLLRGLKDIYAEPKIDDYHYSFSTPDSNSKILRASDAIAIKYNDKFGRHIVATRNIDAGDTAFVHEPYAAVIIPQNFYRFCWYCLKAVFSGIPCHQCVNVIYCDENCRDAAWREHHLIECPVITSMLLENMKENEIMALRIFVKALKEMGSVQNLRDHVDKLKSIADPIDKLSSDGVFDDTKYASVFGLTSDTSFAWSSPTYTYHLKSIFIVFYLAVTSDNILDKKITDFKDLADDEQASFIGCLLLKHFDINMMNAQTSEIFHDIDEDYLTRGIMLLPLMSLFNHNCDFNMFCHTSGLKVALNAVKVIKKGEQLSINYGADFQVTKTQERRSFLQTRYNFSCTCVACLNDWHPNFKFRLMTELPLPNATKVRMVDTFEGIIALDCSLSSLVQANETIENTSMLESLLKIIKVHDEENIIYPCSELVYFKKFLTGIYLQDSH